MFRIIPHWIKTGQADKFREFSVGELPRCTQRLAYQQMLWPGQDDLFGTFCFETVHLSRAVYEHLKINAVDGCVTTLDHDLFDWLRGRDRDAEATTMLPPAWQGIEIVILKGVIEPGRFEVWCHACHHLYSPGELVVPPEREVIGSIHDRLACPAGHLLSCIEVMHLC